MKVRVVPCGPPANLSEHKAVERLKSGLISVQGDMEWVLLTNLSFSVTHQFQSDEIDIVAIGPPGVRVIEVKHWSAQWVNKSTHLVEQEADKLTLKARKIGSTLRRILPSLAFVDARFLITREKAAEVGQIANKTVRGVEFHTLKQWQDAVGLDRPNNLSAVQVNALCKALMPSGRVPIDGSLRRFAGYINLELQTPKEEWHHRIFKGLYARRQEAAILHLYDLSAGDDGAEANASREFDALHRLQQHTWVPRILETFQQAPGYAGEMFFFAIADTAAPNLQERAADSSWEPRARLSFATNAVSALAELHAEETDGRGMVHRNLTPDTVLVKHDNSPIFRGFELARNPAQATIASVYVPEGKWRSAVAPEVRVQGLGASDQRSDVYSLCSTLRVLFEGGEDRQSRDTKEVLALGLAEDPTARPSLQNLRASLEDLLGDQVQVPPPPARYWTEEQVVRFRDRDYRIVARLGSGSVGTTYKVVEIDQSTQPEREFGSYVAKVVYDEEIGNLVLSRYRLARPHLGRRAALSTIFEAATEWSENNFVALMTWVEGSSLHEFIGVFPLLAEDRGVRSAEVLALQWLRTICEALDVLHGNHLVHGDISPRNMIISDNEMVLTDYDCVCKIGEPATSPGTVLYSAPRSQACVVSPSDDIYALAASFFHAVFDKEPFQFDDNLVKEHGLNWNGVDDSGYAGLRKFLDKATDPNPQDRFASAADALLALSPELVTVPTAGLGNSRRKRADRTSTDTGVAEAKPPIERRPNQVEWLRSLLQSYPGSRWGNQETRGLDSEFAALTYVETDFEKALYHDILGRHVRLAILCGNAGDGKTALLQHLAKKLGLAQCASSQRIVEGQTEDGLTVRMNLDGSASWQGRSADELLDEFLEPFEQGPPTEDIAHLLAINDGRLLEWMESKDTPLSDTLNSLLSNSSPDAGEHIWFVSLNQRSLVGGLTADQSRIETGFLERLLDRLYGGDKASEIWSTCGTCSAQEHCEVLRAGRVFGPESIPGAKPETVRSRARQRLFEALQAVHLRGETHITVRELRAALIYILFGVHYCAEYHDGAIASAYWNRAFCAESEGRQGETLKELVRFDPALDAHPKIDRHLLHLKVADGANRPLSAARRKAYFEWTEREIEEAAGEPDALGLAQGRHLSLFRDLPLKDGNPRIDQLRKRLCRGVSRLGDLPSNAFNTSATPLRIPPRTPTETKFWVEKPLDAFCLEADLPLAAKGLDRLHRQAVLAYRYRNGNVEHLFLGADLFHRLLDLSDGYQLGDVSADDTFARLSIFVQRLLREDDREIFAWNPMQDEETFRIWVETQGGGEDKRQSIRISPRDQGVSE